MTIVDERTIEVGDGQNEVLVEADGHSWVALTKGGVELVRESSGEPLARFAVEPGGYGVRTDGALRSVSAGHTAVPPSSFDLAGNRRRRALLMSSDAPDVHVVDGVGEIPADGRTAALVTVRLAEQADARPADGEEVFLRTTGGTLLDATADTRVRSVRLRSGTATFRLVSDSSPRLVTVFAFSRDQTLRAELPLEFV